MSVDEASSELERTITYIERCAIVRREERFSEEQLEVSPIEQRAVAHRLLARKEIFFFDAPSDADGADGMGSPEVISAEASEILRRAIVSDPIAAQAVSVFTGIRAYGSEASVSMDVSGEASRGMRSRLAQTALGTLKGRLTYAKMRRDSLRGKLEAIEQLRNDTEWPACTVVGDPSVVNQQWNKGIKLSLAAEGRFCAYCAQRNPPVLARHRFVECTNRMLSGQPEHSHEALCALEERLIAKESRVNQHLRRFSTVVAHRKRCKTQLAEVEGVLGFLKPRQDGMGEVSLPIGPPPKTLEPICRIKSPGHTACVRFLAQHMAAESLERTKDMRELRLSGGMQGGVWGELKALLVMTPRRSLMLGGLRQLAGEAKHRELLAARAHEHESAPVGAAVSAEAVSAEAVSAEAATAAALKPATPSPLSVAVGGWPELEARDAEARDDEALRNALELLEDADGDVDVTDEFRKEAIAETCASALQSAHDPLENTADHLPSTMRGGAKDRMKQHSVDGPTSWAERQVHSEGKRRGSLAQELFVDGQAHIDPDAIRAEAERLGVDLSPGSDEYFLLPLVVESVRAPLPGGWQEVLVDGVVKYAEETNDPDSPPQTEHPLVGAFEEVIKNERRRQSRMSGRSGSKLPFWVYAAAERWMQFVGPMGNIYFYDFATGETATDIADIVQRVNPRLRNQKNPRNRRLRSEPAGEPAGEFVEMSAHELASEAIEVLGSGSDAQAIEERAAPRPPRHTMSMSQVIDKAREGAGLKAPDDKVVAEQMADVLKKTFQQVLGASLAAAPRPLRQTLDIAIGYSINLDYEAHYLWLADLALALPLPAGWVELDHPTQQATFWHNEITDSSQWQHPVDDFVKATIKMQRSPSSPQVQRMQRGRAGRRSVSMGSYEQVSVST